MDASFEEAKSRSFKNRMGKGQSPDGNHRFFGQLQLGHGKKAVVADSFGFLWFVVATFLGSNGSPFWRAAEGEYLGRLP